MTFRWIALCSLVLFGCEKKPSVAQPAFEKFIDSVAHLRADGDAVIDSATIEKKATGADVAPTEDQVLVPMINVGEFGWTKYTPEAEETLASGDKLITVRTEICMRADSTSDQSPPCMRPNVYRYKALMRSEGSTWKIAGATFSDVSVVR